MTTIQSALIDKLSPILEGMGYELVHLEMQTHQGKTLRVYIDRETGRGDSSESSRPAEAEPIGVEDCAKVSRALDEPLEAMPEIDKAFGGAYELEVSSPGVDRPLRKIGDFERFSGRDARIHTFRPLTADELGNAEYQKRNPKQKNFLGRLSGVVARGADGKESNEDVAVRLTIFASMGSPTKSQSKKSGAKPGKKKEPERTDEILLPMRLISKANIEPDFDFAD